MQTPQHPETPGADASTAPQQPSRRGVDELLHASARGDRAAFSAFYDATVPWVHGMATAMFRSRRDAAEATAQTYLAAWSEAPEAELDLSDRDAAAARERRVFAWLEVLAHRVMTGLLRTDALPGQGRRLLPERAGLGSGGPTALPATLEGSVSPETHRAVRLAWLGGRMDAQVAAALDVSVDRARTLLRDGVQELVAAHRADQGLPAPAAGARPALAATTREDVDAGRGAELADLSALHALDAAGHTAAAAAAQQRGAGELALWRTRVDAGRRAVAWAFRDVVAEPPSDLLDGVLRRLPAQDMGLELVDETAAPRGAAERRRGLKTVLLGLLALLVLALGVYAGWSQFSRDGITHRVHGAKDLYTTSEYPATGGGTMQGFLSDSENSGYVTVSGMPQLEDGQTYQVWLYPKDGSAPSSLGTYDADGFDDPISFRGLDRFAAVSMTVEPFGGSPEPTADDVLLGLDLDPSNQSGPQYGGMPSNN